MPKSQPAMLTPAICTRPLLDAAAAEEVLAGLLLEAGAAAVVLGLAVVVGAADVAFTEVEATFEEVVAALAVEDGAEAAGVHWE